MIKIKKKQKIISVNKVVEQLEFSYTASKRENWYNHYRNLFDNICKIEKTHNLLLKDSTLMYGMHMHFHPTVEMHMYIHQYTCTRKCKSALFVAE